MKTKIHIYEEQTKLIWGLITLVSTIIATYILAGTFTAPSWANLELSQLLALGLFIISFIGIFKLAEPLYHFILHTDKKVLTIEAMKGDKKLKTIQIHLEEIAALKFEPDEPRSENEALFDFAKDYHIMWRKKGHSTYQKLLDLEESDFVLKVDDIAKIMRFISNHNSEIYIPREQASYFGIR
jgi:hypothetical protein